MPRSYASQRAVFQTPNQLIELDGFDTRLSPQYEISTDRSNGSNVVDVSGLEREHGEGETEGPITTTAAFLLLCMLYGSPTTTPAAGGLFEHVWNVPARGDISPNKAAVRFGDETRVDDYTDVFATEFGYEINREASTSTLSASFMGAFNGKDAGPLVLPVDDGEGGTETPAIVVPALAKLGASLWQWQIGSTAAAVDSDSDPVADPLSVSYSASDITDVYWTVNRNRKSFAGTVKSEVNRELTMVFEVNDENDARTYDALHTGAKRHIRGIAELEDGSLLEHSMTALVTGLGEYSEEQRLEAYEVTYAPTTPSAPGGISERFRLVTTIEQF